MKPGETIGMEEPFRGERETQCDGISMESMRVALANTPSNGGHRACNRLL